jgi:hypothetical protein
MKVTIIITTVKMILVILHEKKNRNNLKLQARGFAFCKKRNKDMHILINWEMIMNKKSKNSIIFIIFVVIVVSLISCEKKFDKDTWNSEKQYRARMVGDLTKNILPNMKKKDILLMLGNPEGKDQDYSELMYILGAEYSISPIDYDWLVIYLDKDSLYLNYEIISG